jgi:hypothetical protein
MVGYAKASMTLDTYADLFDVDLDRRCRELDEGIRAAADQFRTGGSDDPHTANELVYF